MSNITNITFVLFQDGPDADNFISIAYFLRMIRDKYYGDDSVVVSIYIVVVATEGDLSVPQSTSGMDTKKFSETIPRDANVIRDTQYLLVDTARSMETFLKLFYPELFDMVTAFVVDISVLPSSPVPIGREYLVKPCLFGRGDLFGRNLGDIIEPEEYIAKVVELNALGRGEALRAAYIEIITSPAVAALGGRAPSSPEEFAAWFLAKPAHKAITMDTLVTNHLSNTVFDEVYVFGLAPVPGMAYLLRSLSHAKSIYVGLQAFAVNCLSAPRYKMDENGDKIVTPPRSMNLGKQQYNVAGGTEDMEETLNQCASMPNVRGVYAIPTEAIKNKDFLDLQLKLVTGAAQSAVTPAALKWMYLYTSASRMTVITNPIALAPLFDPPAVFILFHTLVNKTDFGEQWIHCTPIKKRANVLETRECTQTAYKHDFSLPLTKEELESPDCEGKSFALLHHERSVEWNKYHLYNVPRDFEETLHESYWTREFYFLCEKISTAGRYAGEGVNVMLPGTKWMEWNGNEFSQLLTNIITV